MPVSGSSRMPPATCQGDAVTLATLVCFRQACVITIEEPGGDRVGRFGVGLRQSAAGGVQGRGGGL